MAGPNAAARNLIEQALDQFDRTARQAGISVDEASFVGGFVACFGMVTGKVPIGLPDGANVGQALERIHDHLQRHHAKALRAHQEGFNGRGH